MRPVLAATVLLAACLVASVAIAANDRVSATFESLAASGVVGDVTLNPMPDGQIQLHSNLRGLVPNTDYAVISFDASATCGAGTPTQIVTFKSNAAGIANWNQKVSLTLSQIQSIGIQQEPVNTLVACASVPQ